MLDMTATDSTLEFPIPVGVDPEKWEDVVSPVVRRNIQNAILKSGVEVVKFDTEDAFYHYWHLRYKDIPTFTLGLSATISGPTVQKAFISVLRKIDEVHEIAHTFDGVSDPFYSDVSLKVKPVFRSDAFARDIAFSIIVQYIKNGLGRRVWS
jgi:hypothetical protein